MIRMRRLYLQVYLTIVGSLVLVVLTAGLLLHFVAGVHRNHLCLTGLCYAGVIHRSIFATQDLLNPITLVYRCIPVGFK